MPNSAPSVKRVEAFTYTHAASTPVVNARADSSEDVTIASEWPLLHRFTWSIASSTESTTFTARIRSWNSVAQSSSEASVVRSASSPASDRARPSTRSSTPRSSNSPITRGR
jgi:hypothetical protein